jgi:hypothetical protein
MEKTDNIYFVHLVSGMNFVAKQGELLSPGIRQWFFPVGIRMDNNGNCHFVPSFPFATTDKDEPYLVSDDSIAVLAPVAAEVLAAYKQEYSGLALPPAPKLVLTEST